MKSSAPDHRGSGRGAPTRGTAGPSRPPHLYFDDEDVSILTQREVEAVEARFAHSLQAAAKRPRVIKASPRASPAIDLTGSEFGQQRASTPPASLPITSGPEADPGNVAAGVLPQEALQSETYHTAPEESGGPSRKRPFSEIQDTVEQDQPSHLSRASTAPRGQLFGYVTNHGQYRCALCLSQLPSQEDLARHEQVSKEHHRNLKNPHKVAKGREKYAQVTMVPGAGRHHTTPAPVQSLRINGLRDQEVQAVGSSSTTIPRHTASENETPSETIEVRRRSLSLSSVHFQGNGPSMTPIQAEATEYVDKGKARAETVTSSLTSPAPIQPPPPLQRHAENFSHPPHTPAMPRQSTPSLDTRPTTARTEIGTLYTPHQPRHLNATHTSVLENSTASFPPGPQPSRPFVEQTTAITQNKPAFSPTDIADVMRTTELIVQLMGCVQREAQAVAGAHGVHSASTSTDVSVLHTNESFDGDSGVDGMSQNTNTHSAQNGHPDTNNKHQPRPEEPHLPIQKTMTKLSAPGIDVYTGMKRQLEASDSLTEISKKAPRLKRPTRGREKDTGSEVSFIVLE